MRRKAFLIAGVLVAMVGLSTWAYAGDYHHGASLKCQDCHTMHHSQQHGYNGDGGGNWTSLSGTPHEFLLRNDVNDLCLTCHDGQAFAPDVLHDNVNGFVRSAGALNEVGDASSMNYAEENGHTLGMVQVAPGGAFIDSTGLKCTNCHAAHGANTDEVSTYRNLGGWGTAAQGVGPNAAYNIWITYTRNDVEGANDGSAWAYELNSSGVSANHYGVSGVAFNEVDQTKSAYGSFCKACHTNFHGDVAGSELGGVLVGGVYEEFVRHPTNGVNIGGVGGGHSDLALFTGHTNHVPVMSPTARQPADAYSSTEVTPSCMSCHKGHGNKNAFGLIFMSGTGTVTEEGDDGTQVRDLCAQCHGQAAE